MDTLQVQTKVVKLSPPTWEGMQIVTGIDGTSYEVGLDLSPVTGVYPNANPKLYASADDGAGGKYNANPAFNTNETATTSLVPVLVTVTSQTAGGKLSPNLTITVDLVFPK